ncbi:MAG: tetratricopeptide repeat protein [Burkholderiales bacterium]
MHISPERSTAFLAAIVVATYANGLRGSFQFDDYNVIAHNPAVHSFSAWWQSMPGIRPLLKLSYTANWVLGSEPAGFHAVNVIVHLLNTLLVYAIVRELLPRLKVPAGHIAGAALACTAIFALHPAQTEAVTYISGRSVSLMALFELGALLAWLRAGASSQPSLWRGASVLLFVLAMAAKENAWSLPFALLLCEALQAGWTWRAALRRTRGHWAVLLVAACVVVLVPGYWKLALGSLETRTLGENLLTQIDGLYYLATQPLLLLQLNTDPDLPKHAQWNALLAAKAFALVALLALALWQWRRNPWIGFGILWFFVMLAPTNSVLPRLDVANDRQLYLALMGPALALAVAMHRLMASRRAGITLCVLCVVLALATISRNAIYATEVSLWQDTASKSPHKARVFNNLGFAYEQAGRRDEAEQAYVRALELDPNHWRARVNLENLRAGPPPRPFALPQ